MSRLVHIRSLSRLAIVFALFGAMTAMTVTPAGAAVAPLQPNFINYPATLREGADSHTVVALHFLLLENSLNAGLSDGAEKFGSATKSAVTAFQVARHLSADGYGVVGKQTWSVLMIHLNNKYQLSNLLQSGSGRMLGAPSATSFVAKPSTTPGKEGILFYNKYIPRSCPDGGISVINLSSVSNLDPSSNGPGPQGYMGFERSTLVPAAPGPNLFQLFYYCPSDSTFSSSAFKTINY